MEIKRLENIGILVAILVMIAVAGLVTNADTVHDIGSDIRYVEDGRPYCECRSVNESLHEWKLISAHDVCWLVLEGRSRGGYAVNIEVPHYNLPYYWQRYGNMSEDVKTDCYLLWQTCEKHSEDLGCKWDNTTATCFCRPFDDLNGSYGYV